MPLRLTDVDQRYDVIVVGAGPGGCTAALEQAHQGRHVLLLEASARPSSKLAGEWIHPPGLAILDRLGVSFSQITHSSGRGFVIYPDDATTPIVLAYPGSASAVSCDHELLVGLLRDAVATEPKINLLVGTRVSRVVDGQSVEYVDPCGDTVFATAGIVIGADGRSSAVRRSVGPDGPKVRLSRMAGLLLRDVELPHEEFGHVLLGAPGPVLIYRLGPATVRACLDVPSAFPASPGSLRESYSAVFPRQLRTAFHTALSEEKIRWAANFSAPRVAYGSHRLALVGDATGLTHPLTAAGLTQSFTDASCLARSETVAAYARSRKAQTRVPEMLASALYQIFTSTRPGDLEIRNAVYHVWRTCPRQRTRTMRLLSTQDTGRLQFLAAFLKVMLRAAGRLLPESVKGGDWRYSLAVGIRLATWLTWLARSSTRRDPDHRKDPA